MNFTQFVALLVMAFSAIPCSLFAQQNQADEEKLNVLIIMTDEHNFRTLGCYRETMEKRQAYMWGESVVETPNIDWIAKNGAMFTSFYATTPVCSPSRACLISGKYPQATPVTTNNVPLNDDVVTFAKVLGEQGYKTGFAGKWHLDGAGKPQWAPDRKFGFEDNRFMFNRGHWKKLELTDEGPRVAARENKRPSYQVQDADEETFTTDFLSSRTIEFIEANKESPFCYMLSLPDPHGPDTVRAPYDTMYADQEFEQPESAKKPDDNLPTWGQKQNGRFAQHKYYGMVRCIDDNVGRILSKLRTENLLEKTIVVFTSDHGDLRGEHHRQNKGVPYEGSTRVPFLIYSPDHCSPGSKIDQALTSVDFMPTLLGMLGVQHDPVHGRDFSDLLQPNNKFDWHDIAFVRGTGSQTGWLMAVSDRYKLIVSAQDDPWLFDLERDPDEVINQFNHAAYRETVQSMAQELKTYCETYNDPFFENDKIKTTINRSINGR
jgi:arylsulfatase A-like enzyme